MFSFGFYDCRFVNAAEALYITLAYLWGVVAGNDHSSDSSDDATGGDSHNEPGPKLFVPRFLVGILHKSPDRLPRI